jgi:amino acid transporter
VLAMSLALMAPTAGMALNTPFAAATAKTAVPFIFILTTVGITCVAVGFIRLTRRFNDAGSVYGLTKAAVGPRYGFIAGWCLALVYVVFVATLTAGFAEFADQLITQFTGAIIPWWVMFLVGGAVVWYLGHRDIKLSARTFMLCEGVSILLMFVLGGFVAVKGGSGGHSLSGTPFTPAHVPLSGISAALVFGFFTFIGFEGAATMGEESNNPSVAVPLSVLSAVILAGIVFTLISYAQTIGFGLTSAGVHAYATSAAPNTDLATRFVGSGFATALNVGQMISTFACALASADGAARVLFSLGRDRRLPERLATVHPRHRSPAWALGVSMCLGLVIGLAFAPFTSSPADVYGWSGALATLSVLIAYGMTGVASTMYFWKQDVSRRQYYKIIPIVVAIPLIVYTFYSQVIPVPPAPLVYWPYVMLVYLAAGFVILYVQRGRSVERSAAWNLEAAGSEAPAEAAAGSAPGG